jgi:hypothetical protein
MMPRRLQKAVTQAHYGLVEPKMVEFTGEDRLFPTVKKKLGSAEPAKTAEIRRLLQTKTHTVRDKVAGLRGQDILTTLNQLLDGKIDFAPDGTGMIVKNEPAFYYMSKDAVGFDMAAEEASSYGVQIAFSTALHRTVVPLLRKGYEKSLEGVEFGFWGKVESETARKYPELWRETWYDGLHDEFRILGEIGVRFENATSQVGIARYPLTNSLLGLLERPDLKERVFDFLKGAHSERRGVLIGFGREAMRGRDHTASEGIEGERAVMPPEGTLDLRRRGTVLAVEPMGAYEDAIIAKLGLR